MISTDASATRCLDMLKKEAAGNDHKPTDYVFGDITGERRSWPQKAWETLVLKAHGIKPEWTSGNKLAPASREALSRIDLHFHDLRHEAGSRLLEAGWPLHHVQQMLGHADAKTTSTYLNVTAQHLQDSMRRHGGATQPLHRVAQDAPSEHPPAVQQENDGTRKPLVN